MAEKKNSTDRAKTGPAKQEAPLAVKLLRIAEQVQYLQKTANGGQYSYIPASQVFWAVYPKLEAAGVLLVPEVVDVETAQQPSPSKHNPNRLMWVARCKVMMRFRDAETGEEIAVPWAFVGQHEDAAKAFGSSITYGKRYFLLSFFGVASDELEPDSWQESMEPVAKIDASDWAGFKAQVKAFADAQHLDPDKTWGVLSKHVVSTYRVERGSDLPKAALDEYREKLRENPELYFTVVPALDACRLPDDNETEGGE